MDIRRIFSLFLALVMTFSTFAGVIPANVFASETTEAEESNLENKNDVIATYEIPLDEVTFNEDGSLQLDLSAFEPVATESQATEPMVTEAQVTEPQVTEPVITEPAVTESLVTEPAVTEAEITEPQATEPEATEPEVTEPEASEAEAAHELLTWFQWIPVFSCFCVKCCNQSDCLI